MPHSQTQFSWAKFFFRFFWISLLISLMFLLIFYLAAPFYTFRSPLPFSGGLIRNPYAGSDTLSTHTVRFHLNALHLADVIINGKMRFVVKHHDSLLSHPEGLDISNFQLRHRFIDRDSELLTIYRHGYGLTSDQQLCFGADKVIWTEYPFFQALRHKQDILEKLGRSSKLVALSDPKRSYTDDQLRFLSGYQLFELTELSKESLRGWDWVLSHGHRIYFILSNLDFTGLKLDEQIIHTVHFFAGSFTGQSMLDAFNAGSFYTLSRPVGASDSLSPDLIRLSCVADTLRLHIVPLPRQIRFIGQDGNLRQVVEGSNQAMYVLQAHDTYIRTEISFEDRSLMLLNPLTRESEPDQERQKLAVFDPFMTASMRAVYIILMMLVIQIGYRWFVSRINRKERRNA